MKLKSIWIYLVLLLSLMQGCDPEVKHTVETIISNPQITVSPLHPAFSEKDTVTFTLYHPGSNKIKWEVASKPKWLILDREFGEVNNEGATVKATVRQDLVFLDEYSGILSFASAGAGVCESSLNLFVRLHPDPYFNPSELIFEDDEDVKTVEILNKGKGALVYHFGFPKKDWFNVGEYYNNLYPQEHAVIEISIDKSKLEPGSTNSLIYLYYNNWKDSISLPITVHTSEVKEVEFSTDTLYLYSKDNSRSLMFNNFGNVGFDWILESSSPHLICETSTGFIKKDGFENVEIKIDRNNLENGEHDFSLALKDKDGNLINAIPVLVRNFAESIEVIKEDVIDAKYNKSIDRLIMITQNPNTLKFYNIENHTITNVNLPRSPKSLAFSQDEKYAAVGYEGAFSYFNLETQQEEIFKYLPFDCFDQVITSKGRIIFSTSSQDRFSYYFDLNHKVLNVLDSNVAMHKLNLYLHPSEQFLLTTKFNSSNAAITKYDIYEDSLVIDWKWTNKNYRTNGEIWLLDEGRRIISDDAIIYGYDYENELYMSYKGSIKLERGEVLNLDYSVAQKKICILENIDIKIPIDYRQKSRISIHDYDYLSRIKTLDLPHFPIKKDSDSYDYLRTYAKFCFFNRSGNKIVTILNTDLYSPLEGIWGIYTTEY